MAGLTKLEISLYGYHWGWSLCDWISSKASNVKQVCGMRLLFFLGFPLNMLGAFWFLLPQPALGWQPRLDLACGLFRLLRRLRRNLRKGQRSQTAWHLHSSAGFAKLDDQHVSWAEQVRAALGFGKHLFRTQANGVRIPVRSLVLRHRFPLKWSGASLFKAKNLRNAQGALNACRPGGPMHRNKHSARRRLGISTSDSNDTAKSTACLIGMGTPKIMIAVQVGKPPPFAWLDNIHKQIIAAPHEQLPPPLVRSSLKSVVDPRFAAQACKQDKHTQRNWRWNLPSSARSSWTGRRWTLQSHSCSAVGTLSLKYNGVCSFEIMFCCGWVHEAFNDVNESVWRESSATRRCTQCIPMYVFPWFFHLTTISPTPEFPNTERSNGDGIQKCKCSSTFSWAWWNLYWAMSS